MKYFNNLPHFLKYYKKRMVEDEVFRKKQIDAINEINKRKYRESEEFRQKRAESNRRYYLKKKSQNIMVETC